MRDRLLVLTVAAALVVLAACGQRVEPLPPVPAPTPTAAPPIQFPRDAGAHDALTEWWYYTGHLRSERDGREYGFEFTVFQGLREGVPAGYVAHFAVTDVTGDRFSHQARAAAGPFRPELDLDVQGWRLTSNGTTDSIEAAMQPGPGAQPPFAVRLQLVDRKPPTLHNGGYIEYGPAGGSYYYSRTRLGVSGEIQRSGGEWTPVAGQAWMDHQWGNFVVGGGGWNWFSLQLVDDTELMLYVLRDASGATSAVYGSQVAADGSVRDLEANAVRIETTDHWTSPHTGATYPSGWTVEIPASGLRWELTPRVQDQELYFPGGQTSSPVYWEGAVAVRGTGGSPNGVGYVELTGYAPQRR